MALLLFSIEIIWMWLNDHKPIKLFFFSFSLSFSIVIKTIRTIAFFSIFTAIVRKMICIKLKSSLCIALKFKLILNVLHFFSFCNETLHLGEKHTLFYFLSRLIVECQLDSGVIIQLNLLCRREVLFDFQICSCQFGRRQQINSRFVLRNRTLFLFEYCLVRFDNQNPNAFTLLLDWFSMFYKNQSKVAKADWRN